MKHTATPVYRPTADCIWNSFRSSGRRHLFLTGGRGSGKTSLLSALFPDPLPGVTTFAKPGEAVYLRENETGLSTVIGRFDSALPGPENRMRVREEGFLKLGVPALLRCLETENEWASIDEIGYLETDCEEYCAALRRLLENKRVVAAVRRQETAVLRELRERRDVFVADLDRPFGNLGCVIMASGLGRRFGGNKLLADFDGEPLIQRALEATEGIFARRVVVTRHREVAKLCTARDIQTVLHDLPHRSDTVRLGLEALCEDEGPENRSLEGCLFCPGDQPLLRRETVAALALCGAASGNHIWRPAWEGRAGSPVLFPSRYFEELLALPEGKGGGYVAAAHPEAVRTAAVRGEWELLDADSPEELRRLRELARRRL